MSSNIRFFKGANGEYYFHILGKNGEIVATSEGYTRKWSAKRAAKATERLILTVEIRESIRQSAYDEGFKAGVESVKSERKPTDDPRDAY